MANELQYFSVTGLTVTADLISADGTVHTSAISLTEVASTGVYRGDMPAGPAPDAGFYSMMFYEGGAYMAGDARYWDGSAFINDGALVTIDDFLDTEVAAIKTVTDALPDAGALTSLSTFDPATDTVDVGKINGSATPAVQLALSAATIVSGTAITGTLSTTAMTTDLTEATDDHYNGRIVIWTSGVLQNQATAITDYNGTTKTLTYTAVTEAPSNNDTFIIV